MWFKLADGGVKRKEGRDTSRVLALHAAALLAKEFELGHSLERPRRRRIEPPPLRQILRLWAGQAVSLTPCPRRATGRITLRFWGRLRLWPTRHRPLFCWLRRLHCTCHPSHPVRCAGGDYVSTPQ